MDQPTDSELMKRVRDGDEDAFATLVDRYKSSLVNYLAHLRGDRDRAEEIAQESFLRLYLNAQKYDDRETLAPYLYRIGTNLVRSEFRRLRRWRALLPWIQNEDRAPEAPS